MLVWDQGIRPYSDSRIPYSHQDFLRTVQWRLIDGSTSSGDSTTSTRGCLITDVFIVLADLRAYPHDLPIPAILCIPSGSCSSTCTSNKC